MAQSEFHITQREFYEKAVLMFAQKFASPENYHAGNLAALDAAEDLMEGIESSWADLTGGEAFFDTDVTLD